MRIAFILPSLVNQGPGVVAQTIIRNLVCSSGKIDVFYFDEIRGLDFPCDVHQIDIHSPIDFDSYDIIHSHMYRPDKYVFKWRKKITKALTVTTIHQDIFQNLRYSYNLAVASVFAPVWLGYMRSFDCACPISNQLRKLYKPYLPNLSRTIYNGVDVDYNPGLADPRIIEKISALKLNGYKIIGTYAYITRRKGIDLLLRLAERREDVALVIIGEGEEKNRLQAAAERKGLMKRILFLPYLKQPFNYLSEIDIYAMPSRSEGFGLALVEGACTGTPIVCSDIAVFREIFDPSAVSFFKVNDVSSLSDAVDLCWLKGREKAVKAFSHAKSQFSGARMSQEYLRLYKDLLY